MTVPHVELLRPATETNLTMMVITVLVVDRKRDLGYIHTYINIYIYIHTHIHTYIHTYTHIHTPHIHHTYTTHTPHIHTHHTTHESILSGLFTMK